MKFSGYYFYMNLNIWGDFQFCNSVSLTIITEQAIGPSLVINAKE